MEKSRLRQVIIDHQELLRMKDPEIIERDVDLDYFLRGNEVVIISGIRRCGKSTLLRIIAEKLPGAKLYLDFDDVRLVDLTIENFQHIEEIGYELLGTYEVSYFFDEIQNAPFWERWVNNLFSKGRKVFLTGSNSNLLSSEILTHLTGRNKVLRLFPFSFREFLRLKGMEPSGPLTSQKRNKIFRHFLTYFEQGGFPQINRNDDIELSRAFFDDILNKDVFTRYRVRHVKEVKDLVVYLFSNAGRTFSYSTLSKITGIKSPSTLKNYIDHLRSVYLISTLEKFDYSVAAQKTSSSKPYLADASFFKTIAFNFSENAGKRLENLVYLHLLRSGSECYYHHGKKECDFLEKQGLDITSAIQVCYDMSQTATRSREIDGLQEAIRMYDLDSGLILTLDRSEEIREHNISIKPVWEWLLGM
jgi:uncharacterized protein